MALHLALLRGINVGGKNLIRMPALKECFEAGGFEDVRTYIASGNVLFRGSGSGAALTARIEQILTETFGFPARVVVRSHRQMRAVVDGAPKGFGAEPGTYHSDVLFLKPPLTAASVLKQVPLKEGVDEAHAGRGVVYFSRLSSRRTQSRLSRVVSMPIYQDMTIRSWTTTTKLLQLMDERS